LIDTAPHHGVSQERLIDNMLSGHVVVHRGKQPLKKLDM
jgi:hypothetical protein